MIWKALGAALQCMFGIYIWTFLLASDFNFTQALSVAEEKSPYLLIGIVLLELVIFTLAVIGFAQEGNE